MQLAETQTHTRTHRHTHGHTHTHGHWASPSLHLLWLGSGQDVNTKLVRFFLLATILCPVKKSVNASVRKWQKI